MLHKISYLAVVFFMPVQFAYSGELSFVEFKDKLLKNNETLKSINLEQESLDVIKEQNKANYSLMIYSNNSFLFDNSPVSSVTNYPNDKNQRSLESGFQKKIGYGISLKTYFLNEKSKENYSSGDSFQLERNGFGLGGEFKILKNGFGVEESLKDQISRSEYESNNFSLKYYQKQFITQHLLNYIELAAVRSRISIQNNFINIFEKRLNGLRQTLNDRLIELNQYKEVEIALEERKIAKEILKNEEFNISKKIQTALKGELNNEVKIEDIDLINSNLKLTNKRLINFDIESKVAALKKDLSLRDLELENLRPDLTLGFNYVNYLKNSSLSDSYRCVKMNECRNFQVSINFSLPLDFELNEKIKSKNNNITISHNERLVEENKDFDVEMSNLISTVTNLEKQIQNFNRLILIAKDKLKIEESRYNAGRSSTFDLINSERIYSTFLEENIKLKKERIALILKINSFEE